MAGGWQWCPDEDFSVGWELCSLLWVLLAGGGTEAQSTPRLGVEGESAACALGELGLAVTLAGYGTIFESQEGKDMDFCMWLGQARHVS